MHISEEAFRLLNDKFADALIKLDKAQARIKELKEGLKEYANDKNWSTIERVKYHSPAGEFLTSALWKKGYEKGYTTARKLLEKESE